MATKRKTKAKKAAAPKEKTTRKRMAFEDGQKIKVVAENPRREGSRYHSGYQDLSKAATVGAFRKKRTEDAQELLRAALKDGYIQVA